MTADRLMALAAHLPCKERLRDCLSEAERRGDASARSVLPAYLCYDPSEALRLVRDVAFGDKERFWIARAATLLLEEYSYISKERLEASRILREDREVMADVRALSEALTTGIPYISPLTEAVLASWGGRLAFSDLLRG